MPAIVRDDDPNEIALIENLQREDLTALEEAEVLGAMVARYGYTHQALAQLLHKSRPYVSNMLVLTRLPAEVEGRDPPLPVDLARDPDGDRTSGLGIRHAEALATGEAREPLGAQVPRVAAE